MLDELEKTEIKDNIIEIDYTEQTVKIHKKLVKKTIIVFISSVIIFFTSIIDKHDDFDVVLKSDLFLFLLAMTIMIAVLIMIFTFKSKDSYNDERIYKTHKGLLEIFELFSIVPVFMVIISVSNMFIVSPSFIDGASMEPNYYDGEDILFWHFNIEYESLDVVILQSPTGNYWIKRIIGMPGDQVIIDNGIVYVNDIKINQDFLKDSDGSIDDFTVCRIGNPDYCVFNVPLGEYFVLGDNRSVSDDSRSTTLGYVSEDELFGKVIFKFNNFLRN